MDLREEISMIASNIFFLFSMILAISTLFPGMPIIFQLLLTLIIGIAFSIASLIVFSHCNGIIIYVE